MWQGVAIADNWGGMILDCDATPQSECVAQNGTVDYWFSSDFDTGNGPDFKNNARAVLLAEYNNHPENNGDIYTFETNKSGADARLNYHDEPAGYFAWTECTDSATYGNAGNSKAWCEPEKIVFNKRFPAQFDTYEERRAMACHEVGHVFGLRHRNTVHCMENPPGSQMTLGDHDMQCLVKYYPLTSPNPHAWDCP